MMTAPKLAGQRGRPRKSRDAVEAEAAFVLEVALALRQGRIRALEGMGLTEAAALRAVMKRRRGPVAALIGSDALSMVKPDQNKTERAADLVVLGGMPVAAAARTFRIDRRNLFRALPAARDRARAQAQRQSEFAERTIVETVNWNGQDTS